jgi:hypothetical protein
MRSLLKATCLALAFGVSLALAADPSAPVRPDNADQVIKLDPYTVSAVFPAIRVRFVLSGKNLRDPLDDPITEARVVWVEPTTDPDDTAGIQRNDQFLAVNDTELRGLTLRQVADLVSEARQTNLVIWEVRRGFSKLTLRHNGKWKPPLPGLER